MENKSNRFGKTFRRTKRRFDRYINRHRSMLICGLLFMVVGLVAGTLSGDYSGRTAAAEEAMVEITSLKSQLKEVQKTLPSESKDGKADKEASGGKAIDKTLWNLVLVNTTHPMADGYVPELVDLENEQQVDARIAEDAAAMLAACRAEGLDPMLASAYRSVEKQISVFNETAVSLMGQGYGFLDAYNETASQVAIPGQSEHALGLALDIISSTNTELDGTQAQTAESQWLAQHCAEYGFILRYPPEKSDITKIIYESWHYRYVGKEYAQQIMSQGLTLEEFLGETS